MNPAPNQTRVAIVEGRRLILNALVALCRTFNNVEIIATARNGGELLQVLETARPEIIIMGIPIPLPDVLEPTHPINETIPWPRVIALSMSDHPAYVKKMLKIGVRGIISINAADYELEKAIVSVFQGETCFSDDISRSILKDFSDSSGTEEINNYNSLSYREIQIIQLLSDGCYTREIAEKLFISSKTVERHKTNILKKLNLRNTAHLVKMAIKNGIIIP